MFYYVSLRILSCPPTLRIQRPPSVSATGCMFFLAGNRSIADPFLSCSSPKCAAHNFGYKYLPCLILLCLMSHPSPSRNLSCIGCGSQRSPSSPTRPAISSPRFSNTAGPTPTPPPLDNNLVLQKPSPHHPLLTPSGRAFASGGKVQNISTDPLNPCIMFWPDNEPFPDQGQIRPSGLVGISVSIPFRG